jgi:hypothetical protein
MLTYAIQYTRAVQWKTGKVVLKIACTTDVIVCRVCKGGDLELPIDGIGTPAARIGTWGTVRQVGGALATVHQARVAKCCEIFVQQRRETYRDSSSDEDSVRRQVYESYTSV